MPSNRFLVRSASVLVYGMAIFLGFYLFAPVSGRLLAAIPLGATLVVIAHAVRADRLDELGYAIVGL